MLPIEPNPENGSPLDVEQLMQCTTNKRHYRRLHALKLLLEGFSKPEVAKIFSVSIRSIQKWINLWNAGGIDNLEISIRPPTHAKIPISRQQEILDYLRPPEDKDQTPWTIRRLHGHLRENLRIYLGYSTLTRFFRKNGYRLKFPRSWPLQQDESARELFREEISNWIKDKEIELWFGDETGIAGDPRPRRIWAHKSDRPRVFYRGSHLRENIIGAINPESGEFVSLIMGRVNSVKFQYFLDELAIQTQGRRIYLVLDNASWHKAKCLNWHNIAVKYLPVYSPDLNPIERLWLYLKEHYFKNWYAKDEVELQERVVWAIRELIMAPDIVKSVTKCELSS